MSIKIAGVEPSDIKLGSQQVQSVYAGSTQVWENITAPFLVGTLGYSAPGRLTYLSTEYKLDQYYGDTAKIRVDSIAGIKAGDFVVLAFAAANSNPHTASNHPVTTNGNWLTNKTSAICSNLWGNTNLKTNLWCGRWPGGGQENNPYFGTQGRGVNINHCLSVSVYRGVTKLVSGQVITTDNSADLGSISMSWQWPKSATMPSLPASTGPSIVVAAIWAQNNDSVWGGMITTAKGPTGFTVAGPYTVGDQRDQSTNSSQSITHNHSYLISEESESISPGLYHVDQITTDSGGWINGYLLRLGTDAARSIADAKINAKDKVKGRLNKREVKS